MVRGTVKWWDDEAGWGVLTSRAFPGDVFAHFTCIEAGGYRSLNDGEEVEFDCELVPPPGQTGSPTARRASCGSRASRASPAGGAAGVCRLRSHMQTKLPTPL